MDANDFLVSDFNQCFQQMRHYDDQIINICKFAFLAYSSVTGGAVGLYKFGVEKNINLTFLASVVLVIGLIVGLFIFAIVIRNRVYFVRVTRYINEVRGLFLKYKPLGFENRVGIHTDWQRPRVSNLMSSQLCVSYIVAFLNTILFGALIYMQGWAMWGIEIAGVLLMFWLVQILSGIEFLRFCDRKWSEKTNSK